MPCGDRSQGTIMGRMSLQLLKLTSIHSFLTHFLYLCCGLDCRAKADAGWITNTTLKFNMDIYYPDNGIKELIDYILDHGTRQRVKRGTVLVHERQPSDTLYLIRRGAVKGVCTDNKNHQRIIELMFDGELVGSYISSRLGEPSPFAVVTLEDCLIYSINIKQHNDFFECDVDGQRYVRAFTEHLANNHLKKYLSLVTMTPWQRLEQLQQHIPNIMQRISRRDIAAFIGVSPESLSRHLNAKDDDRE